VAELEQKTFEKLLAEVVVLLTPATEGAFEEWGSPAQI
jgi:hypothetical protein